MPSHNINQPTVNASEVPPLTPSTPSLVLSAHAVSAKTSPLLLLCRAMYTEGPLEQPLVNRGAHASTRASRTLSQKGRDRQVNTGAAMIPGRPAELVCVDVGSRSRLRVLIDHGGILEAWFLDPDLLCC